MPASRTCRLLTFGCKVNQYETQYVKEVLEANGYREARADEPADLCIVNTCTVTHEADAKARQLIRGLAREQQARAVVVMGCYATREPETVRKLPGVVGVIPDKAQMIEALRPFGVSRVPAGISRFDGHRRAFVKVQDGCLLNCSFCIIPQVRPRVRSRPIPEVVAEVERLVQGGCQEIVLTGIHLGHYGIDLSRGKPKSEWSRLWHLIRHLDVLSGDFRMRLSSLEAAEVRGELVEALAASRRVCPHLHLCLQSGSDRILALMKRRYRVAGFVERCRRLSEVFDLPALTTDIILGFPGESAADFEATCEVVQEVGFSKLHLFSYSARQGTLAATMPGRVPPPVIAARRAELLRLEERLAADYHRRLVGHRLEVMVEGPAPGRSGWVTGTSCRYAPVSFEGHAPALLGRLVTIETTAADQTGLLGKPVPAADRSGDIGWELPAASRLALPLVGALSDVPRATLSAGTKNVGLPGLMW